METIEISEYVDNLLQEDTSTDALEQSIIMEAAKLEAEGKATNKMEEPSATLSEDPFERRLRSQATLRRKNPYFTRGTGYYGNAPLSRISVETKERVRNARRQLFKA